jgi:hypothetical protein
MTTTTLSRQPEVVECPTFRCDLCVVCQIHNLRVRCPTFLATVGLDASLILLPLAGNGEVARIAADRNWEIHASVLICDEQFVFRRLEQ